MTENKNASCLGCKFIRYNKDDTYTCNIREYSGNITILSNPYKCRCDCYITSEEDKYDETISIEY